MKNLKKLLSGMLAIIMMSTMFLVPVKAAGTVQVSSTGSTVIGASSFTWSSAGDVKDNENGYDKKVATTSWGGGARTAEVTLNVEKSGTYTFDVNAVINLTLDGASPLKFSVDGGSQTTLTTSNATVSALATPFTVNGWTVKNVAYKNEIALKKGEHTLTFEIPMRSSGDAVIYAFDCATIKPVNIKEPVTVKANENTTIGTSSFMWSAMGDVKDNENGYDKKIAMTDWGGGARTAEVTLNVEETGTYSFDVNAVIDLALDGASPLKFSVDGGSQTTLTTSNATVCALATPWTINGWTVKNISYKSEFVLEEGEHTLAFEIPKRSNGDAVIYGFDCATIRPTNNLATVGKSAKTTFGNSSFKWNHSSVGTKDAAYDGTYTIFQGGGATITATKTFYVEDEFEYELEVYAASSATNENLSNLEFKIDDGTSTVLNSSNSTVSTLANPCRTDAPWTTKSIKYNTGISLTKGMHTITFTVPQSSNGRTEAYFVFDCASFIPVEEKEPVTVKAKENTTIGASSFTWSSENDVKANENGYDKTIAMTDWGGVARTAEVTLNVEETGTYSFDVNAVIDLALDGASPLKFSIDGGSQTTLTASNTTVSALASPWTINGWTVKNISYKNEFTLEAGEHTLAFEIPKRSSGDIAIYVFDCATIRPTGIKEPVTIKADSNTTIGTSSFVWSSKGDVKDNENGYDKTIAMTSWGGVARTAEVTLIVEKTGTYSFDVNAVIDLALDGGSPLKFSIDGGSQTTLTTSNATVSALASPWTINGWTVKNISYKSDFALEEGEHTLTFEIPMRSGGDAVIYGFDCATIRPTNNLATISKAGSTTLGNSSFTWNHSASANNNAAYDGTYTIFQGGGATIKATQTVYVADTHEYELEVYGASSVTNENLSNLEFIIDDGESVVLSSSNSTVSELENPCRTGDAYATKSIKYKGGIMLEEGTHTITFKVPQSSNGKTAAYFAFDCAIISPAEIATVNNVEITTFGNSSFRWNREFFGNNANAADGTYSKAEGAGMTITATKTFYVENADNYKLEVYGASSATNDALSDIEFKIDDGDSTVLSASNSTVRELSDPCRSDYPWTTKGIKYNEKIALSEGMHTITFTVPQNSNGRTEAYFVFDCLRIIPDIEIPDIQGIEAEIDDYTLDVGTVSEVTVTDTEGNAIDYATISSSDSNVIYVGVDKKLYAVGVGRATIIVSARMSEDLPEHTASFEVLVGNGGVFVKSIVNNNGEITATYELDGVDPSSLDTYVAVYSDDDCLLHFDMADITDGKSILNTGNVVGRTTIFVWEKGTLRPYYKETIRE